MPHYQANTGQHNILIKLFLFVKAEMLYKSGDFFKILIHHNFRSDSTRKKMEKKIENVQWIIK